LATFVKLLDFRVCQQYRRKADVPEGPLAIVLSAGVRSVHLIG